MSKTYPAPKISWRSGVNRHPVEPSIIMVGDQVFGVYGAEESDPPASYRDEYGLGWADSAHTIPWRVAPGPRGITEEAFREASPDEFFSEDEDFFSQIVTPEDWDDEQSNSN